MKDASNYWPSLQLDIELRPLVARILFASLVAAVSLAIVGCADDGSDGTDASASSVSVDEEGNVSFGDIGSLSADSGFGSFRFGAASAATQIEDKNENTDWYQWALSEEDGGEGKGTEPIGQAVQGFTRAGEDIELMKDINLDAYRFSVSWGRIEPERDQISESGLQHYDDFIDDLIAAGIRPMITLHHFSQPKWISAFGASDVCPEGGPSDENLCGWDHPEGGPLIVEEMRQHAKLLAQRYGDRIDEWCTINEPINYGIAAYGVGFFPPGRNLLVAGITAIDTPAFQSLLSVYENFIAAHVAMYDAIKEFDTIDADGDGVAASIGFTLNTIDWESSKDNEKSDDPLDEQAEENIEYIYHYFFPSAIIEGGFDRDLDGVREIDRPEWAGKLDWLGVQYYSRQGVTGHSNLFDIPGVDGMICFDTFDFGSCIAPEDPTFFVPEMGYEYYAPGFYNVLADMGAKYPGLPLVVTEAGIATNTPARRAENIVRNLEQVTRAVEAGVDIRGFYYWSLTDNFEWAEGYGPRFGLYNVDYETYERTLSLGGEVVRDIAAARAMPQSLRETYGGVGPMTPEIGGD